MTLEVHRPGTVEEFLASAGAFLAEREAEHNLPLGICTQIRTLPELFADDPPRFVVVKHGDRVVGATLRTPPFNQVLSEMETDVVDAIARTLEGESLPGVLGPQAAAARFVERWTASCRVQARLDTRERIFRLERVIAPRPVPGRWRLAEPRDRELLADWIVAFVTEAVPGDPVPTDPLAAADRWIAGRHRRLYAWEDAHGRVVSMVGAGGETPRGVRIGPVYTPPAERGHGYASALTAAASQDQLDRGRQFCFLFTDLANPTSNHIYQAIGYEPVRDVDLYRFQADA